MVSTGQHFEFKQPAFGGAIVKRRFLAWPQAHQLRQAPVGGQQITVPAGKIALESAAQRWVEGRQLILFERMRIADHDAGRHQAGAIKIGHRRAHRNRRDVAAVNLRLGRWFLSIHGGIKQVFLGLRLEFF